MASKSESFKVTMKISSFIMRTLINIIFYVMVIIIIVNVSSMTYNFAYQLYGPVAEDAPPGRKIYIQINKGESTMEIASKLENMHAIVNKYSFYARSRLLEENILPGTYEINSSMTYKEILDIITDYSKSIIQDNKDLLGDE